MGDVSIGIEQLIEHEPFLRRLACSLLADADAADDVVQEAWLRAVATPPREPRALRAWLSRVVTNLSIQTLRREGRRRRLEAKIEAEPPLPSPEDVIEREHVRRDVMNAVFRLAEPYRSTVIWVHLEGVSPKQLAERLRVPASTVRSRLQRGLDQVRERLDGRYGGRTAWGGVLAPLLHTAVPEAAATATFYLVTAASIAAVALVAAWSSFARHDAPGSPAASKPHQGLTAKLARADESEPTRAFADAFAAQTTSVANRFGVGSVNGSVRHADGSAAAGVRVVALGHDPLAALDAAFACIAATTAADGSFGFARLDAHRTWRFAFGHGSNERAFAWNPRAIGVGAKIDLGEITLSTLRGVHGRIVASTGAPVAGARIMALSPLAGGVGFFHWMRSIRADLIRSDVKLVVSGLGTDAVVEPPRWSNALIDAAAFPWTETASDGSFELTGVDLGAVTIIASAPGMKSEFLELEAGRAGTRIELEDVAIPAGASMRVHVRDACGIAVAGAEILAGPTAFAPDVPTVVVPAGTTDATGAVVLNGLTEGEIIVAVRNRDGTSWSTFRGDPAQEPLEIRLPGVLPVVFDVRDAQGKPRPDAQVRVLQGAPSDEWDSCATSVAAAAAFIDDGAGHHAGPSLPAGTYTAWISAAGSATTRVPFVHRDAVPVPVRLQPGLDAGVRVLDALGAPCAGATVIAIDASADANGGMPGEITIARIARRVAARATTDAAGKATLTGVDLGAKQLLVRGRNGRIVVTPLDATKPSVVRLASAPTVDGGVLQRGVAPNGTRRLMIEATDANPLVRGFAAVVQSDERGRFQIAGLTPGQYRVFAAHEAEPTGGLAAIAALVSPYVSERRPSTSFRVNARGATRVWHEEVPTEPGPGGAAITVAGDVRIGGVPAAGVDVQVAIRPTPASRRSCVVRTRTAADGTFHVAPLRDPETLDAQLETTLFDERGRIELRSAPLRRPASSVSFDVTFETFVGSIEDASGPVDAATIVVSGVGSDGARVTARTQSAADGAFHFDRLPRGTYSVDVLADSGTRLVENLTLDASPPLRIVLGAGVVASGRFVLPAGTPLESDSSLVFLAPVDSDTRAPRSTRPNADGSFTFEHVVPGRYTICAFVDGRALGATAECIIGSADMAGIVIDPTQCRVIDPREQEDEVADHRP